MKRLARRLAPFLLALLLPVQGLAAACAQICLEAHAQAMAQAASDAGEDCHGSAGGEAGSPTADGKCCHGHTFMMQPPVDAFTGALPAIPPLAFVTRWTSFIPEEPSPPPIASAT
jgi:hypothetical protein